VGVEADSITIACFQCLLQGGEGADGCRNGEGHGSEFAQNLLPLLQGGALLGWTDGCQYLLYPRQAMVRQGDGIVQRADHPTQYHFRGGPRSVTFRHFLVGGRFLEVGGIGAVQGVKDRVQCMQEGTFDFAPGSSPALHHSQKIVNVRLWTAPLGRAPRGRDIGRATRLRGGAEGAKAEGISIGDGGGGGVREHLQGVGPEGGTNS
jgi:hypothetical protein